MSFRPAGDSDDDDCEDDFAFDNDYNDSTNNSQWQPNNSSYNKPSVNANGSNSSNQHQRPTGGFGQPPEKPSENRGHTGKIDWKRTSSGPRVLKSKGNIPVDDFKNAVMRGSLDRVQAYIDEGIVVDTVLRAGWTALMYASHSAQPKMVQLLLANGANPSFHYDQYSVLMAACASSKDQTDQLLECIDLLIGAGADVNAFDRFHMTALIYAAKDGRVKLIETLLENGANMDKQDNRGYTALMWAACEGHVRAVHVLLESGADFNKRACDGSLASDLAMVQGHTQVQTVLKGYMGGDANAPVILERLVAEEENKSTDDLGNTNSVVRYGDLELFLSGLECSNLIPLFQQHQVTFAEFLKMSDHDLIQMGIKELGVRKKILDAINSTHKKSWETTSIQSFQYNKALSCAEILSMVGNISQHTTYISSTIYYLRNQIKAKPDVLKAGNEESGLDTSFSKTEEAIASTEALYKELVGLSNLLAKLSKKEEHHPPDLIRGKQKKKSLRVGRVIGAGLLVSLIGLSVWKGRDILEFLKS